MGWFAKGSHGGGDSRGERERHHKRSVQPSSRQQPSTPVPKSQQAPKSIATEGQTTIEAEDSHDIDRDTQQQEEGMVVVDGSATGKTSQLISYDYDVEDTKADYSKDYTNDQQSTQMNMTHPATNDHAQPQQNHLNSLFNGHLMKWKFEAEEGSAFIRVPAFAGALGLIVTSIVALVLYPEAWTTHSIVMSVGVITMSIFIIVLDGRFLATNPLSARAHLRNVLTRNFNIFRYVWGRSILYIVAGVLNVAQLWLITICSGAFMIFVGLIGLAVGIHASRKFAALRSSLADESFLLLAFSNFDGDGDGYLEPHEFANLLSDLGMELDDRYTLKAFNVIDSDNDRRISFDEFNHWWASGYIERGRKKQAAGNSHHHGTSYRRLD